MQRNALNRKHRRHPDVARFKIKVTLLGVQAQLFFFSTKKSISSYYYGEIPTNLHGFTIGESLTAKLDLRTFFFFYYSSLTVLQYNTSNKKEQK